jgi:alpha-amylase
MRKGYNGTQTITVLSNLGEKGSSYTLSLPDTGFGIDTEVTEIYTCATTTVDHSGNVHVQMVNGEPSILYPRAALEGSTICS